MAAAYQGGGRVSPEQLPRLWKAYAEFEVLPSGVVPMPCEFIDNAWGARGPAVWAMRNRVPVQGTVSLSPESRNLLGFEVRLPQKAIDYPLDVDSRGNAPWVWQVSRALSVLVAKVRQYYADPDRYGSMTEVALRWHPNNFYERRVRNDALAFGPRNVEWIRTQLKLALDERVGAEVLYAWGKDSFHLEELMHVAHIAILERTDDPDAAKTSSRLLGGMAKMQDMPGFAWKPLRTATSILAVARWAATRDMPVNDRYYLLGDSICQMVPEPPFKPNFQLPANGSEEVEALVAFEKWFARERTGLKQEAANEIAHLNDLAAELGTHIELPR